MADKLLTRDQFREAVFKRDNYTCVFCAKPAVDAHHIIERRLFPDGGYYLNNGASVCEEHHLACERTDLTVEKVRDACGITKAVLPPHLYSDNIYDKWGNIILPNGTRLKGDLFSDESVQKVLAGVLHEFVAYVKYPRTYHLPWSGNINDDDRVLDSLKSFENKFVVVTEKMDGENTSLYHDYIHARSLDSSNHQSRNWVKNFWSSIKHDIPEGWRICGENLFAEHSIRYDNLSSYFMGFSVWNDRNICLSWAETQQWFSLLGIDSVPVLYSGIFDVAKIKALHTRAQYETSEGYVVRLADEFSYKEFRQSVAKYVRNNHIQTVKHWMTGARMVTNKLSMTRTV